jgi:uncharacterized membrane protein YbhN (UPF0104 family)
MVGAFVATGLGAEIAVPAVLLFRFVTFWLSVPLGAAALVWLCRQGGPRTSSYPGPTS